MEGANDLKLVLHNAKNGILNIVLIQFVNEHTKITHKR